MAQQAGVTRSRGSLPTDPPLLLESSAAVQETWSDLFDPGTPASTAEAYRVALRHFFSSAQVLEAGSVQEVTEVVVGAWDQAAESAGVAKATRRQRLAAVSYFYQRLRQRDPAQGDPAREVRRPRLIGNAIGTTPLEPRHIKTLIDSQPGETWRDVRDRTMLAALFFSALKISELTRLNIGSIIDQQGERRLLVTDRRGRHRRLLISAQFGALLDAYLDVHPFLVDPDGPLFASTSGRRICRKDLPPIIKRRFAVLGINSVGVTSHSFRAASLTSYLDNGGDLRAAQQLAGHDSISTTRRYDRSIDVTVDTSLIRL